MSRLLREAGGSVFRESCLNGLLMAMGVVGGGEQAGRLGEGWAAP